LRFLFAFLLFCFFSFGSFFSFLFFSFLFNIYAPQNEEFLGSTGVLFIDDQQTTPQGRYTNRVTKSSYPMNTGAIGLIGASFLGPLILRLGSIKLKVNEVRGARPRKSASEAGYADKNVAAVRAAELGDADSGAHTTTATVYRAAVEWFHKAADQGHASAHYSIGCAYYHGDGLPANKDSAVEWFKKAAELDDAEAQDTLGLLYSGGACVPLDTAAAVEWYHKAAEQGHAKAQYTIGLLLRS
jgi:hypothetical protein